MGGREPLSTRGEDSDASWRSLAFELQAEGIPQAYLINNRAQIYSLLEEVVEEVGTSDLDDIDFGDSALNQMTTDSCI